MVSLCWSLFHSSGNKNRVQHRDLNASWCNCDKLQSQIKVAKQNICDAVSRSKQRIFVIEIQYIYGITKKHLKKQIQVNNMTLGSVTHFVYVCGNLVSVWISNIESHFRWRKHSLHACRLNAQLHEHMDNADYWVLKCNGMRMISCALYWFSVFGSETPHLARRFFLSHFYFSSEMKSL